MIAHVLNDLNYPNTIAHVEVSILGTIKLDINNLSFIKHQIILLDLAFKERVYCPS